MQALFGCLMIFGLVLMAYPFLPLLTYIIAPPKTDAFPYATRLESLPKPGDKPDNTNTSTAEKPKPQGNRLVIPKIGVDIPVVEGTDERALLRGAWRIPGTSGSPADGNMVLSAHRFRYRPPSSETFYLLNKLETGDVFILYWNDEEYDYRVANVKEVGPDAVSILNKTSDPRLTLFTCTPLFSTARRLVVVGEPI